jgi:hypothetical protein
LAVVFGDGAVLDDSTDNGSVSTAPGFDRVRRLEACGHGNLLIFGIIMVTLTRGGFKSGY